MPAAASRLTKAERSHLTVYASVIVALHAVGWLLMWLVVAPAHPFMWGFAGLAYTFGLRHAFDADHIAAIDNTARKLMEGQTRPLGVGFFFSLGHSTVVFVMTLLIALGTRSMTTELPGLKATGAYIGATVSGVFLYVIGVANLIILIDIVRVFLQARAGEYDPVALEARLLQRGWFSRWFGGVFRMVRSAPQMYWVGLLFGLGFDTASEIGLLTTAGIASSQVLPLWSVLLLPVIFAAGMSLVDSADGVLMCGAYGWAFANPLRKIFYNITITGLSVVVALFVGTIELASIVVVGGADRPGLWGALMRVDSQQMGLAIAALFLGCWAISVTVWHLGGFEQRRSE